MWVRLRTAYPTVAARSCADCQKYVYDDHPEHGEFGAAPQRMPQSKAIILRVVGQPTPCWGCPKIPGDAPEKTPLFAIEPTERSVRAYQHYRESRAVGMTDAERADPIVRRNAALIADVLEQESQTAVTGRLDGLARAMIRLGGG
jgi:hypothetical protein